VRGLPAVQAVQIPERLLRLLPVVLIHVDHQRHNRAMRAERQILSSPNPARCPSSSTYSYGMRDFDPGWFVSLNPGRSSLRRLDAPGKDWASSTATRLRSLFLARRVRGSPSLPVLPVKWASTGQFQWFRSIVPLNDPEEMWVTWFSKRSMVKLPVASSNRPVPPVMVAIS
jgi:hypothetical protein